MPSCATCGALNNVRLYQRRDAPDEPRFWWCVDCWHFAIRLQGVAVDPVARWVERAALHELPARPVDEPPERRVLVGRRSTDQVRR